MFIILFIFYHMHVASPIEVTWIVSPYKYFLMKQIAQLFARIQSKTPNLFVILGFPRVSQCVLTFPSKNLAYLILEAILAFLHRKDASKDFKNSLTSPVMVQAGFTRKKKNTLIWWN